MLHYTKKKNNLSPTFNQNVQSKFGAGSVRFIFFLHNCFIDWDDNFWRDSKWENKTLFGGGNCFREWTVSFLLLLDAACWHFWCRCLWSDLTPPTISSSFSLNSVTEVCKIAIRKLWKVLTEFYLCFFSCWNISCHTWSNFTFRGWFSLLCGARKDSHLIGHRVHALSHFRWSPWVLLDGSSCKKISE